MYFSFCLTNIDFVFRHVRRRSRALQNVKTLAEIRRKWDTQQTGKIRHKWVTQQAGEIRHKLGTQQTGEILHNNGPSRQAKSVANWLPSRNPPQISYLVEIRRKLVTQQKSVANWLPSRNPPQMKYPVDRCNPPHMRSPVDQCCRSGLGLISIILPDPNHYTFHANEKVDKLYFLLENFKMRSKILKNYDTLNTLRLNLPTIHIEKSRFRIL